MGKSHAIRDHTVLTTPGSSDFRTFTLDKAGTQFSDPEGMQGWVDLGGGYIARYITREIRSPIYKITGQCHGWTLNP